MSMQNQGVIDLSRLPTGTHEFDIQLDDEFFASLEKSEILSGTVSAQATLHLREEDYSLNLAVHGTVFVACDRCLDPMPIDINDEQEIWSAEEEEISNLKSQISNTNRELDLSWLAYEIVSINIPIVHSHQTGECNKQMELLLQNHLCDELEPEE